MIPETLVQALRPVTVVVGHYGSGKTNFSVNLALDLAESGRKVSVIDLDVVNPYFRASEQRPLLENQGVHLIAPVFAEAGTNLDVPSLTGQIVPALEDACDTRIVIVDAGGDDVGATALGRFSRHVLEREYAMLYVANKYRNLVQDPVEALSNLREIEIASHLAVTGIANNSHLVGITSANTISDGFKYAETLAELAGLPLVCTTVPMSLDYAQTLDAYPIRRLVKAVWE